MRLRQILCSLIFLMCLVTLALPARPAAAAGTCPDFNHDGSVDVNDVTNIAARWATASADPRFDRDGDGSISVTDIQQVADHCNTHMGGWSPCSWKFRPSWAPGPCQ